MTRWGELDGRYDDYEDEPEHEGRHRPNGMLEVGQVFHCGDFGGQFLRVEDVGFERIWPRSSVDAL
jgi:hypothetical protein